MIFNKREIVSCIAIETISKKDNASIENVLKRFASNGNLRIFNSRYLQKCPANSIVAKIQSPSKCMILYPFFSSHMSLPIKPGEHVWAFFPDGLGSNDIGYWMTRRSTDDFIEDPNFTHNARSLYKAYNNTLITNDKDNDKGMYYSVEGRGVSSYESLLLNTEGNSKHVFESVQRTQKKPSDLLFQGSNNTQLVFTCGNEKETGTIIMTSGRGKTSETSLEKTSSNIGLEESNKASRLSKIGSDNASEGNIDILNDRAILILSENPSFINESLPEDSGDFKELDEMSHFFAKADIIRSNANNEIHQECQDYFLKSENGTIDSSDFSINAENLVAETSTFNVSTNGWNVDMQTLFDIIEELINQLNNLTSGAAVFATGVGPTGPATNATQLASLLSKISAMKG